MAKIVVTKNTLLQNQLRVLMSNCRTMTVLCRNKMVTGKQTFKKETEGMEISEEESLLRKDMKSDHHQNHFIKASLRLRDTFIVEPSLIIK